MTIDTDNPAAHDAETGGPLLDAIEALSQGIAIYDPEGLLVTCNQRCRDMYPMVVDLLAPGTPWKDFLHAGAERGQFRKAPVHVMERARKNQAEGVPDGQTIEVDMADGAVYDLQFTQTRQGGFVVVTTDSTEKRQAAVVAQEQENILRTVLETSPVIVVMARLKDGRILYRSPAAIEYFGETTSAVEHYVDPMDRETYIEALREFGKVDDFHLYQRDLEGRKRATTISGRLVEFEGETYIVTAIMDLSEHQERDALIRQVLEACPTPIQMTRATSGEVLFASPETVSLFGRIDLARDYYADADTRERYLKELRRSGSVNEFKAEYINAEGKRFWGSVSARLIRYNGEEVIVSNTRDLTEQLKVEAALQRQQDQLFQNEKMSAMGELLAGVAHELNNPLSVVVGHSLMLREECQDADTLRQVEKISKAAERCARIVKTFLTMARQQPVKMQRVDINEIIRTAVDVARYSETGHDHAIDCRLDPGLPLISADPDQITQVIVNLLLNAEHAMVESGTGDRIEVVSRAMPDGTGIEITVEDNGPGIPKSIRSRIFDPFFTTKDIGKGTGIGLTLSHRIVQTHNGTISLLPARDGGSVFRIVLHVEDETPAPARHPAAAGDDRNSARILIVDDEIDVAELNAEILTRSGYEVDVFNQAGAALDYLRSQDYALIISDLNMPGVDGRGFFETIARDFPHMIDRTGFVTGDTMGRSSQTFLRETARPYIEKPVSPKELRTFVAEILAQTEQADT